MLVKFSICILSELKQNKHAYFVNFYVSYKSFCNLFDEIVALIYMYPYHIQY